MMWRDPGLPTDSFYEVRPECNDVPKTKFKIKAGKTLSVRRWQAAFSPEGHLDIASTLSRIQRGIFTIRCATSLDTSQSSGQGTDVWKPPSEGWLKMNVDAEISDLKASFVAVRNSQGLFNVASFRVLNRMDMFEADVKLCCPVCYY